MYDYKADGPDRKKELEQRLLSIEPFDAEVDERETRQKIQESRNKAWLECGIKGKMNEGKDLSFGVKETYIDLLEDSFRNGKEQSFWLVGPKGTGKTRFAAKCLYRIMTTGFTGRYITSSRLMREIMDAYKYTSKITSQSVLDAYSSNYDLLVIDEVGRKADVQEPDILFDIINERKELGLSVILISNLDKNSLGIHLGDALVDRFADGSCKTIQFDGESLRRI